MDAERILRPLLEARGAVEALDTYESPDALADAVRGTWQGVDRTLRTFLRADASAPDSVRMTALSPQMSSDAVMAELRRRNFISLALAGKLHELTHALQRIERGDVRAADADTARAVVDTLVHEVNDVARRMIAAPAADVMVPAAAQHEDMVEVRSGRVSKRPLILAAIALLLVVVSLAWIYAVRRESALDRGIAAFRDGRAGLAEQHFRRALQEDAENATAQLYLARILRKQGRFDEAAPLLRAAVRVQPQDAAVRRELGYLFLDLDRPPSAVEQLRQAVELEPAEPLNWVGLYQAMVRARDPGAAEVLRRAPAEARSIVERASSGRT